MNRLLTSAAFGLLLCVVQAQPGTIDTTFNPTDIGFGNGDGPNDDVFDSALQPDGKIIVVGGFTSYNGTSRNRLARVNADGSLDDSFNPGLGPNGGIFKVILQPDGKIIIGGVFTSFNGTGRNHVARLNSDGSLDVSFDPGIGANGTIRTGVLQSDGKIIIGGDFTSYGGTGRNRVARLNPNGSLDTGFDPGTGANSIVWLVSLQTDGRILLGGSFSNYNGTGRNNIARLSSNGTLDASFNPGTGANGAVYSLVLQPDGKVIIGGDFSSYNGTGRNRLARLNSTGTLDTSFLPGSGPNSSVTGLAWQPDGKVVFGGGFSSVNGVSRSGVARLNADGTWDAAFNQAAGANGVVSSIVLQSDGKVFCAGGFVSYSAIARNRLARLNADGSLDLGFNAGSGANATVLVSSLLFDGRIVIGGEITIYNGTSRNYIARLLTDGEIDQTFDPGTGANGDVQTCIVQPDEKIIIGGNFTSYNGIARNRIARLNSNGALDATFDPGSGVSLGIYVMALQADGKIIIGGDFTTYNGTARNRIARLNPDGSLDVTFTPGSGANGLIRAIALQPDGKLIIAGYFTSYAGTARSRIARLNSDGSLDNTFNPGAGADGGVQSATLQPDGKILIAGFFTQYNGVGRNYIARVNANGGLDTSFTPGDGANGPIQSISLQPDGRMIIGGWFTVYNGVNRSRLARLNTSGGIDSAFDPGTGAGDHIYTTAVQPNGKVIIGGRFTSYAGTGRNRLARVNGDYDCPVLQANVGDPCNTGGTCIIGQTVDANCTCSGGQPVNCDDGDPCTTNTCVPAFGCQYAPVGDADNDGFCDAVDNCPGLPGVQGNPCNDNNPNTQGDVITAACICAGHALNDACENAQALTAFPALTHCAITTSASTSGATPSGGSCEPAAYDIWYLVGVSNSNAFSIDLTPLGVGDMGIEVLENCGGAVVYCATGLHHLIAGQGEYLVRVFSTSPMDFTICALRAPLNNEYQGAEFLDIQQAGPCGVNGVLGTTSVATSSGAVPCAAGPGPDVWYGLSSISATMVNVELVPDGAADMSVQLIDATMEDTLYCGSGNSHTIPVAPFMEYYIKVASATAGDFSICVSFGQPAVTANVRVILDGPYNNATGLMNDDLRSVGFFPYQDPYPGSGYVHTGCGIGGTTASVFTVSGNNAVVDWVVLELRDATAPAMVVASRTALLQRDGDVVDLDGVSPMPFYAGAGNYHVAVRHRNHLGCMTNAPVPLGPSPVLVDFTTLTTSTWGTNARRTIGGAVPVQVLWSGDVTFDHQLQYTGSGNDRDPILVTVGSTTPNNVVNNVYSTHDVNMDGQVKYTGSGNDRDPILVNVGSIVPNNIRGEQLP